MRYVVYVLIALMFVLHQDFWFWDNPRLYFGFMPVGLLYHAVYSVVAALVWALAILFLWPRDIERFAEGDDDDSGWAADAAGSVVAKTVASVAGDAGGGATVPEPNAGGEA